MTTQVADRPDHLLVPVSYGMIRVLRLLPADIVNHMRNAGDNKASGATARFDVTLATLDGEVCIEIEGFTMRRLDDDLAFPAPDLRELAFDGGRSAAKPASAAEGRLLHAFSQGIRPQEVHRPLPALCKLGKARSPSRRSTCLP
jgi:hypothetical protein